MALPVSFVDSNILIYAFDGSGTNHQRIAAQLVVDLRRDNALVLSTQVLNETYRNLTNPKASTGRAPVAHSDVLAIITRLISEANAVVSMSPSVCLQGYDLAFRHKMHLWDAMILAASLETGAVALYTEDMPGAVNATSDELEGIRYINPFLIKPKSP